MYVHACRLFICRLPIVQGGTFTFVAPSIAILSLPRLACPAAPTTSATPSDDGSMTTMASINVSDMNLTTTLTADDDTPAWHYRIREVSNKLSKCANRRGLSNIQKIVMSVCREVQWTCTRTYCVTQEANLFSQIQGAIMVASLFQVLIGFSGLMGFLLKYIGPLSIAPTIALAGLALFDVATGWVHRQFLL